MFYIMSINVINEIFLTVGIDFEKLNDKDKQESLIVSRDFLLSEEKYKLIQEKIPDLKKYFSSSFLTSLQIDAEKKQKWPLINLIRQILKAHNYEMKPIRKSNGYTKDGKKKYIRYYLIQKIK